MTATSSEAESLTIFRQVMLLVSLSLGTLIFGMAMTVVNVILPQIQGSLSATQDQVAWVVTFHIIAVAMATPLTGWISGRLGRRRFMTMSIAGFTVTTVLCGAADSLPELVVWRIAQGLLGAPMFPLVQAILLDVFPRRQHAFVVTSWGLVAVWGSVIGAVFGGYVGEAIDWRWAFYLIAPIGILSWFGCKIFLTEGWRGRAQRLDWVGFLSLIIAIGSFQLMLDRGLRLDWFESPEIIIEAIVAGLAFYVFLVHSLTSPHPFLNLRLLLNRNFTLGLIFGFLFGTLFITPMVLFPPLLQDLRDFPESTIGMLLSARGLGNWVSFAVVVPLTKFSPRLAVGVGFACHVIAGLGMAHLDMNLTLWDVFWTNFVQGFALGIIYVPVTVIAFSSLSSQDFAEGSAVFHMLRNVGSSIFISISVTLVVTSTAANYAGLTEFGTLFNELFRYPGIAGVWNVEDQASLISLSGEMYRQGAMIGYINAFYLYTFTALLVFPLLLLVKTGGDVGMRR
ncbi:MAG: MFS transporter [Alphaproteobacteria bacterium]|nr:MFS transporter [Alphaproteobacteria bacterium]|tara:strand:- start:12526 stop:14052 length:1527 start_codon:yes stop_codon:yes gene_type:complete